MVQKTDTDSRSSVFDKFKIKHKKDKKEVIVENKIVTKIKRKDKDNV